jgi:hypothetical protein
MNTLKIYEIEKGKKPTLKQLTEAAKHYYSIIGNSVGGNLNIVLDDGNVEDKHLEYCLSLAKEKEDEEGIALCKLLFKASITQRKKLTSKYEYA